MFILNGNKISTFQERFSLLVNGSPKTASQIAASLHVAKQTVSMWLSGARSPKTPTIETIAYHFEVNPLWLCGFDVPRSIPSMPDDFPYEEYGLLPMPKMRRIPLLGDIACGVPILAEENHECSIDIPEHIDADFSLRCKGDSMVDARIFNGDIVYIRQQSDVNDGEIAAVLIDGEATLKRVYKIGRNRLELRAENRAVSPMRYEGEALNSISILGKAVYFTSVVK